MPKYVYECAEGSREMADLLGGKGANLAEMTRIGLPVPAGFTVTTPACRAFLADGAEPDGLAEEIADHRFTTADGTVITEGTALSVDGTAGTVHLGALPLVDSPVMHYFETGDESGAEPVARAMRRADTVRRLEVRANADTPQDAARARRFGAQGIGLCRTEQMFLGERRALVEAMILARTDAEREAALAALLPLQREDFTGILEAMDGLPVTIRLLDPPLHEFPPDRTELAVHSHR